LNEVRSRGEKQRGLGLTVMKERAHLIGGTLEITSCPGAGGTRIVLTAPTCNMRSR
jgi:signal transduction histidine kinase